MVKKHVEKAFFSLCTSIAMMDTNTRKSVSFKTFVCEQDILLYPVKDLFIFAHQNIFTVYTIALIAQTQIH